MKMLSYMLIMVYINRPYNKKILKEISLKFRNCFKMFKTKNNLWILKVLPNNNRKFVNLNKRIKLSVVSQIINNKGSKQQKWGQNNHIKIVFVLLL